MSIEDRPNSAWLIPLLASFTGAAALVNEVSWSRQIGLVLGQTPRTGALVLISFFGGLALGQILSARVPRTLPPGLAFGLSELAAGVGSALVPFGLRAASRLDSPLWASVVCAGTLLPATISLGLSWPFLARWARDRRGDRFIAVVYAVNTLGGLLGVVSSSAFLLVSVGVVGSNRLAAATAALAGLVAVASGVRSARPAESPEIGEPDSRGPERTIFPWYALAFSSGFLTLALQVLAARFFSLVFHNSTYTFSLIVAVSLASLSIGSALVGRLRPSSDDRAVVGRLACRAAVVLGVSLLAFLHGRGLGYLHSWLGFGSYLAQAAALVALTIGPSTAMLGMILPTVWIAGSREGLSIGRLTAVNSLGAAFGAWLAEFIGLPVLGLWGSLASLVVLTGLVGVLAVGRRGLRPLTGAALGALLLAFTPSLVSTLPRGSSARIESSWQGPHGLLEIVRVSSRERVLRLNLHYGLGATGDSAFLEYRQGHIPLLLHPNPKRVLFLGLGTGLTAAAALDHESVDAIQIVELIPEVVLAAREFSEENFHLLGDPRVSVTIDDARHVLRRPGPLHDVIVSDLFIPWESRTGYLYTVDFYRQCRRRLARGGLFCQWLPLYQLGEPDFDLIAESFSAVFPHTTLWWGRLSSDQPVLALVGSDAPLGFDPRALDSRLFHLDHTREPSDDPYLGSSSTLGRLCFGARASSGGSTNTDEHPRVEFRSPLEQGGSGLLRRDRIFDWFDRASAAIEPPPLAGIDAGRWHAWQRSMLLHDDPRAAGSP